VHKNAENIFGFDIFERHHKNDNEFLSHIIRIPGGETWFSFVNVETKDSQSSGCIYIHQTCRKSLDELCQKTDINCFLGQERSANGRMHATKGNNIIRSALRNTAEAAYFHSE
jgi:hypothetical protein